MAAIPIAGLRCRHLVLFVTGVFAVSDALLAPGLGLVPSVLVLVGCAGALLTLAAGTRAGADSWLATRIDPATLILCALAALVLCVLGGEGHFLFANYDWLTRDAVLADLSTRDFPVLYGYQGQDFFLRAPLGMYLIPAAVGRVLGLRAADLALLVQNAAILAAMLALLTALAPRRKALLAAVFVGFGGLDILTRPDIVDALATALMRGQSPLPYLHQHLGWWNPFFQYTSHLAQIFWVPNHAFPGWWLAILCLLYVRRAIDAAVLVVSPALLLLWSPLSVAGALPVIAVVLLRSGFQVLPSWQVIVAALAGLCFLPIAAYLQADAGSVPHGWLILQPGFWTLYALLIVIEIPHAAVVWLCRARLDGEMRPLTLTAIVMLLLIPIYGLGANNDFAMRASIMPLAVLAFAFALIVVEADWRVDTRVLVPAAALVLIAAVGPLLEIGRALSLPAFAISDCNLMTTWNHLEPDRWLANYFARLDAAPAWLLRQERARTPVATIEQRACWPGHPWNRIPAVAWREPDKW